MERGDDVVHSLAMQVKQTLNSIRNQRAFSKSLGARVPIEA